MELNQNIRREETPNTFNSEGALKLVQSLWRDFGPLLVGALVLIVVLVGGWTLFKKSQTDTPQDVILDTQTTGTEIVLPESVINLSATPTPQGGDESPTPSPTPKIVAKKVESSTIAASTKGELPKTGPEITLFAFFASLIGTGFALHKYSSKI